MKREKYYSLLEKYENILEKSGFGSIEYLKVQKELMDVMEKMRRVEVERLIVVQKERKGKYVEEVVKKKLDKFLNLFDKVLNCMPITTEDYADTWVPCTWADSITCFWDGFRTLKRGEKI